MTLDTRSLAVVAACVTLVIALLQLFAWRRENAFPGSVRWKLGNLCVAASLILSVGRDYIPDWVSIVLANAFAAAAPILWLEGTREFRAMRPRVTAAYVSGGIVLLGCVVFTYVWPNVNLRIFASNGHLGAFFVLAAVTLLRGLPPALAMSGRYTSAIFAGSGAIALSRAVMVLFEPPIDGLFSRHAPSAAFYLSVTLLVIGWSFGFFLLANQRLLMEVGSAERAASQMAHRLEIAVQATSAGLWDWDFASRRFYFSPMLKAHLGYADSAPMDSTFKEFIEFIHPEDRDGFRVTAEKHLKSNEPFFIEFRLRTAEGEYRWFRSQGQAEWDEAAKPTRMVGTILDISEERSIREKLRLSEERLTLAIDGSNLGLWDWNITGGDIFVSGRFEKLLGIRSGAWERGEFFSLIHPDDANGAAHAVAEHLEGSALLYRSEFRMRDTSGEWKWMLSRGRVTTQDSAGRPLRMVGTLADVTSTHEMSEELWRALESAEAATRAKSTFLAAMSHEIRTPMNGILGMTGILLDSQITEDQRDCAEMVRSSAEVLLTIINDILDFSKIEAGKIEIEQIEFNLHDTLEEAAELLAGQAAAKGIELVCALSPETPRNAVGDPVRIRQVVLNLLSNAVKFTERGEVVVRTGIAEATGGRFLLRCEVSDTGIGIDPEAAGRLFQPFSQGDSSTTRRFGGTGLGLAISKQLAERMGGAMGVDSAPGSGSRFWFTVSLETAASAGSGDTEVFQGARVLVADGHAASLSALEQVLSSWGMRVETASSSDAAFHALESSRERGDPIRIAVVDQGLPRRESLDLLGRNRPEGLRTILLSSRLPGGVPEQTRVEGDIVIPKPVRRSALHRSISRILDGPKATPISVSPAFDQGRRPEGPSREIRILLAEDNLVNQKIAVRLLANKGYEVAVVSNGREAVDERARSHYDLILMDCQMPVMDGYCATREIRDADRTSGQRTPIVAMTANAMAGDRQRCLESGMDDYLSKPIRPADLYRIVELWTAPLNDHPARTDSALSA